MDTINKSKYDRKPTSYAANGKIMLCSVIILFIVVFTIACFHSYVHCCFHRHHPRRRRRRLFSHPVVSLTTLLETSLSQITNTKALDPSLLKSLPTFTYSATTTASNSNSHNHINCQVAPLECAVCLSEFEDREQGRRLPNCNHNFHVDCIDTWFRSQSNCPLCRAPVQPDIPVQKPELSVDIAITINETAGSAHERDEAKKGCYPSTSLSPEEHGKKPLMELVGVSVEEVPNNVINSNNYTSLREIDERLGKGTLGRASKIQNNYNGGFKSSGTQILSLKRIWSI